MTRLRKMMLEELPRRNYSAITTRNYLRVVTEFAKYFGKSPDKLGLNELRTYQAYLLTERKLTPGTVVNRVAALRFFFVKTLKRHQFREFLPYPRDRRRLPTVLSLEEVARLIDAAGTLFRRTLMMQGLSPRGGSERSMEQTCESMDKNRIQGGSAGRSGNLPRSPYPSRARSVDSATVHGKRLNLPQEICPASLRRLRWSQGCLTAGQKSA